MVIPAILASDCHYHTLRIPLGADDARVRRAFLSLSLLVHPDKSKHPKAEEAMQRVNLAFETLETAEKRAAHEEAQRAAAQTGKRKQRGERRGHGGSSRRRTANKHTARNTAD